MSVRLGKTAQPHVQDIYMKSPRKSHGSHCRYKTHPENFRTQIDKCRTIATSWELPEKT